VLPCFTLSRSTPCPFVIPPISCPTPQFFRFLPLCPRCCNLLFVPLPFIFGHRRVYLLPHTFQFFCCSQVSKCAVDLDSTFSPPLSKPNLIIRVTRLLTPPSSLRHAFNSPPFWTYLVWNVFSKFLLFPCHRRVDKFLLVGFLPGSLFHFFSFTLSTPLFRVDIIFFGSVLLGLDVSPPCSRLVLFL